MARMLLDRDSTNVHLNAARRHERLARRYRRAELAAGIKPFIADRLFPQLKAAKRSRDAEGKVIKGEFAEKTA